MFFQQHAYNFIPDDAIIVEGVITVPANVVIASFVADEGYKIHIVALKMNFSSNMITTWQIEVAGARKMRFILASGAFKDVYWSPTGIPVCEEEETVNYRVITPGGGVAAYYVAYRHSEIPT